MKVDFLYYCNIIIPISYLYNNYLNEVLQSNIYAIEDTLNFLDDIRINSTNKSYIKAIIKAGEFFDRLVASADLIPNAKNEKDIVTALEILIRIEEEESLREEKIKFSYENMKKIKELKIKRSDELVEKFFDKIEIRKEIIDMYDNI